jgi:hypothetical protein
MCAMQTAIYSHHQNSDAQHQACFMEVVAGYLLYDQLIQRRILGGFGQMGWHLSKNAWKLGHAVRAMMDPANEIVPALSGIVELDQKYVGGKPRYQQGVKHKRGKGTAKQ